MTVFGRLAELALGTNRTARSTLGGQKRGCANKTGHCAHDTFQAGHPAARLDLAPQPLEAENGLIGPSGIAVQQA
jgi:hypothetical protein